jgi:polyphosphate kinase
MIPQDPMTPPLPSPPGTPEAAPAASGAGLNGASAKGVLAAAGTAGRGPGVPARPDVTDASTTFNRDLSWLEFNRRVLALALDERTPLLERVRFLSIFSSNLDEFVMKRLGQLQRRIVAGQGGPDQDGLPAPVLLAGLRRTVRELQMQQYECYEHSVKPALEAAGVQLVEYQALAQDERRRLRLWYRQNVFPVLTPLAVDQGHRFPFISNLSRNLGVLLTEPGAKAGEGEPLFARVKVPSVMGQWVPIDEHGSGQTKLPARGRYVSLADIIQNNLDDLFPGMRLAEVVPFRLTRDAEPVPGTEPSAGADADDDDDLLEQVQEQLRQRKFAQPVRLEVGPRPSASMLDHLCGELELSPADAEERPGPLDYTILTEIADLDRPEHRWPKWTPTMPKRLADKGCDVFSVIREGDLLVHHPFESFDASAVRFITEAARDPDVLAIKQTIYRTSKDSPFVQSLIRAAEAGKQVAVLIELRARFDEQANVRLAQMLEKAGAHVAYGVIGYKTHCKAALVVRREQGGLRTYAHLGTGNYHPRTAQLYTDLGLFTCDAGITDDVVELFNFMTGRSRLDTYETLLVAPVNMKKRFLDMIERETQQAVKHARGQAPVGGRIICKMNAFADSEMAEALYRASRAGVQVTLFVRGFCCLRPGVEGLSENIRVVSVLGRFLEHSRIFHFGRGAADPLEGDWFISSADWMYRNLNNRVEAASPVTGRANRAKLLRILQVMAADRRGAWDLLSDGTYRPRRPSTDAAPDSAEVLGTFEALMREARG